MPYYMYIDTCICMYTSAMVVRTLVVNGISFHRLGHTETIVLYFINLKLYSLSVYIYFGNTHRIQRLVRNITLP